MARVTYTADELRKRGISIVKDPTLIFKKNQKNIIEWAKTGLDKFDGSKVKPLQIEEDILYKKGIDPYIGQKWVFPITPIPAPRMTQGQLKLLHIHDRALSRPDLATKRRLLRYFEYKEALTFLAKQIGFVMPHNSFHVTFYIPHRLDSPELEGSPMQNKPDVSNLMKALEDALCEKDQLIWDYRITKLWTVGKENGRIEVTLIQ